MRNQQNSDFSPLGSQHLSSILCSGQNPANLVCLNKNCIKYGFICSQESCQCFSQHKKCLHVSTKTIKQIILDKEVSLKQLEKIIDEKVDKLIDSISIFREKTIAKIKQGFAQFGLSNSEKSFIQTLENNNPKFFTGKQMWEIHMNLQKEQEVVNSLNQAQKDIKKSFLDLQNSAQMLFIEVQQSIKKLKLESEHYLSKRNQRIFQNSRIFKGHEQQVKIQMFLGKLKIKTVELLYRASDNMFDIELFHLKCDNIPFTLTVCQTEFNKIVGGYTSIPWRTLEDWEEATDQTSCSFIFSLTNNDYFSLRQPSKAIIHRNDFYYGPQFGGGADLCIADKANINSNSFSRINSSYFNKNYQQYDKESYKKFSGSETEFFRIKEWEVWRIQFEQQE